MEKLIFIYLFQFINILGFFCLYLNLFRFFGRLKFIEMLPVLRSILFKCFFASLVIEYMHLFCLCFSASLRIHSFVLLKYVSVPLIDVLRNSWNWTSSLPHSLRGRYNLFTSNPWWCIRCIVNLLILVSNFLIPASYHIIIVKIYVTTQKAKILLQSILSEFFFLSPTGMLDPIPFSYPQIFITLLKFKIFTDLFVCGVMFLAWRSFPQTNVALAHLIRPSSFRISLLICFTMLKRHWSCRSFFANSFKLPI